MAISGRRRIGIVAVVAALAVAAVGVASVRADPAPDLPPIRGDALLASTLAALARPFTISGDVETRFDLGIPQIPSSVSGGAGGGLMGAVSLVTGDQRYKVWHSTDGVRVAHLLAFSEQDLIREPERCVVLGLVGHVGGALRRPRDDPRRRGSARHERA